MLPENFHSQAGMEVSLRAFIKRLNEARPGTFNDMLSPKYAGCDFNEKSLTVIYETTPWMSNPVGAAHGGVVAGMLDTTMGSLAFYMAGETVTPTITLQVSYLRPVLLSEKLYVKAVSNMAGRTMCHLTAIAWLEGSESKPVATASGSYYAAQEFVKR